MWDDLWLEQDGAAQFVIVARRHEKEQVAEADKAAVREVCIVFMRMKLHTLISAEGRLAQSRPAFDGCSG
jgi:hypothetical protein